jgi:hypothetical protein
MSPLSPDFRTVSYAHCFPMQDVWIFGKLTTRGLAKCVGARFFHGVLFSFITRAPSAALIFLRRKTNFTHTYD